MQIDIYIFYLKCIKCIYVVIINNWMFVKKVQKKYIKYININKCKYVNILF